MPFSASRAFAAYLQERFPPVNMALFAIVFLTVRAVVVAAGGMSAFGLREVTGIAATISFFYRLRVFDELKDYSADLEHHPHRVLQTGRVTLGQLGVVAVLGSVGELLWSAWMGPQAVAGWGLAAGYSLLMRYEFGVGHWLRPRLLLYAGTHLLVMPLVILWLWWALAGPGTLPVVFGLLAALSLLGGLAFEVARKIRPVEVPGLDSYSRELGYGGAIAAVLGVLLGGVLVQARLLRLLHAGPWPLVLLGLLYLITGAHYFRAWRQPEVARLKRAELLTSLFMLVSYGSILIEIHGFGHHFE
ncbi:hypothetical protein HMJ29_00800 [Hymenobacter taeanensis]|uniref:UbiA family prenyltransferase n=1 Tax=Hymenobacter taeanensis TaxID=2735321 RepID=A0A6M6BCR0_9BACT|nr:MULTISPECIES: hypothetical protein [Hymenobacter]QJX45554.1 hypothetical protein HMJ29_00800 [Hymenobacter taeanensis]UOQ81197.1 hypothetical protein MUN83_20720 [Hymenobacter sp. 5414T-23]